MTKPDMNAENTPPTTLQAGCKVNLFLHITGRRPDGYHQLESLFVPAENPHDTLTPCPGQGPGLELTCSRPELLGAENTLHRSYDLFARETGWAPALTLHLDKKIPCGAGLGGGSADAACLLSYLQAHCPSEKRPESGSLQQMAAKIGADVPFFLSNAPAWVRGIGEVIDVLDFPLCRMWMLILCPDLSISTARAYQAWDAARDIDPPPRWLTQGAKGGREPAYATGRVLWNSFEQVLFPVYPHLQAHKRDLLACGASGAVLSGSGSTLVGLFRRETDCIRAAKRLASAQTQTFIQSIGSCWGVAKW